MLAVSPLSQTLKYFLLLTLKEWVKTEEKTTKSIHLKPTFILFYDCRKKHSSLTRAKYLRVDDRAGASSRSVLVSFF